MTFFNKGFYKAIAAHVLRPQRSGFSSSVSAVACLFFAFFFLPNELNARQRPVIVESLRCEYRKTPINIDIDHPHLSWEILSDGKSFVQHDYEIEIGTTVDDNVIGQLVWQSGKVISDHSINIFYAGQTLASCARYYWHVRVAGRDGHWSPWSKVSWFETGFMDSKEWKANWIGDERKQFERDEDFYGDDRMPLFKKAFTVKHKIRAARLYIAGLGYYEFRLNARSISSNKLDPGFTSYRKQVLYNTYDITNGIKQGQNLLSAILGNGWWNPLPLRLFKVYNLRDYQQTGRPCLKASIFITYDDGSSEWINSDKDWKTAPGPVIRNSVYLGERYDATLENSTWLTTTDSGWKNASLAEGPSGLLTAESQPPIKVTRVLTPRSIKEVGRDTFIVDMGQNFAGVARIMVSGKRGTEIRIKYGEDVHPDGRLNYLTTVAGHIKEIWNLSGGPGAPKTAWQEDRYVLKGTGTEMWAPRFTFHSFRYLQITGWPGKPSLSQIRGLRMNADLEPAGSFYSSDTLLNKLHDVVKWTFLSNVFSVQSDCPGREKMGYGGDMIATANAFMFNYNMAQFYSKSVKDFANDQQPDGAITEIAPYTGIADHGYGGQSGPLGWELAFSYLQGQLYEFYADTAIIKQNYVRVKNQLKFLEGKANHFLFDRDISDHEAIDPKPEQFSASAFYYHHALLAARFAGLCGQRSDSVHYALLSDSIKAAILAKYQKNNGVFDGGTESAQAFALWYKLPSDHPAALSAFITAINRKQNHIATGIFGTKMLFDILRESNNSNLAFQIVKQKTFPGWGFMLDQGATTLWESWTKPDNAESQNHPMFGSVDEWLYRSVLGINPLEPGFRKIMIKPQPPVSMSFAGGSYHTPYGKIAVDWCVSKNVFKITVSVPANTTAVVCFPDNIKKAIYTKSAKGQRKIVGGITDHGKNQQIEIGSGQYIFYGKL